MTRPKIRGDCMEGPRPCPWVSCRQHLGVDIHVYTGRVVEHPGWEDRPTCALDEAERGGMAWSESGEVLGVTRQAAQHVVNPALMKLRMYLSNRGITPASLELEELDSMRARREGRLERYSEPKEWGSTLLLERLREMCK